MKQKKTPQKQRTTKEFKNKNKTESCYEKQLTDFYEAGKTGLEISLDNIYLVLGVLPSPQARFFNTAVADITLGRNQA